MVDLEAEAVVQPARLASLENVQAHRRVAGPLKDDGQDLAADPVPLVLGEEQEVLQPVVVAVWPQSHAPDELAVPLEAPGARWVEGVQESLTDPGAVVSPEPFQRRTHRYRADLGQIGPSLRLRARNCHEAPAARRSRRTWHQ